MACRGWIVADPFYTCCEDGMLSRVPPTDRSGLCPQCHPGTKSVLTAGQIKHAEGVAYMLRDEGDGEAADVIDMLLAAAPADGVTLGAPPKMTEDQLAAVCLAVRHDYGLLGDERRAVLRHEARVWEDAFRKVGVLPVGVMAWHPCTSCVTRDACAERGCADEELERALGVQGTFNDQGENHG